MIFYIMELLRRWRIKQANYEARMELAEKLYMMATECAKAVVVAILLGLVILLVCGKAHAQQLPLVTAEGGWLALSTNVVVQTPYALLFDGLTGCTSVDGAGSNAFFHGSFSISTWCKITNWTGNSVFWGAGPGVSQQSYVDAYYESGSKNFRCEAGNLGQNHVNTTTTFQNDTNWHNLVVSCDSTGHIYQFWVDATNYGGSSLASVDMTIYGKVYLGAVQYQAAPVGFMRGALDETVFWQRILTGSEVTNLYNSGLGLYATNSNAIFTNEVRAIYHMDDGTGVYANDASGNNNTGTNIGGVVWSTTAKIPVGQK